MGFEEPRTVRGGAYRRTSIAVASCAVLATGLGLTGCGHEQVATPGAGSRAGATAGATSGTAAGDLEGRTFLSSRVTEHGAPRPLVPGTRISLLFHDGEVRADAGCNHLVGKASLSGGRLVVGTLGQTDMGCPGKGRYAQDTWLAKVLRAKPVVRLDKTRLTLAAGSTKVELVDRKVAEPNRPLEGTHWALSGIVEGAVAVSAPQDSRAYVQFDGGRIRGNTGCNALGGKATLDPTARTIRFGPIITTKMACSDDVMLTERQVLGVLSYTADYSIEGNTLRLTKGNKDTRVYRELDFTAVAPTPAPTAEPAPGPAPK